MPSLMRRTRSGVLRNSRPKTIAVFWYLLAASTAVSGVKPPAWRNVRGAQMSCCETMTRGRQLAPHEVSSAPRVSEKEGTHEKVELLVVRDVDRLVAGHPRLDAVDVGEVRVTLPQLGDEVRERLLDVVGLVHLHALELAPRREADAGAVGADSVRHGAHDVEREAAAVLDRAAVVVGALVRVELKELVEEVACGARDQGSAGSSSRTDEGCEQQSRRRTVGSVYLDAVTSCLLDEALGRVGVVGDVVLRREGEEVRGQLVVTTQRWASLSRRGRDSDAPGSPAWSSASACRRPRTRRPTPSGPPRRRPS